MTIPTPEFIENDELNDNERKLIRCAANGEDCELFDKAKASARADELQEAEAKKPGAEQRDSLTLLLQAIREQAAADAAPTIRADLIRFLARGGNDDYPVDPFGVRLMGARITETLSLEGCRDLRTLNLNACHFDKAPILLDAAGQVINFSGSYLPGLWADGLITTGGVFLRQGFEAAGAVRLLGAKIGGNLDCSGGKFPGTDENGNALHADGVTTTGDVFLNHGFAAAGSVRFLGAKIGGDFSCEGGKFAGQGAAFDLQAAKVTGGFIWRNLLAPPKGFVNLDTADVGALVDDGKSWPEKGRLILDGFSYGRIAAGPTDYASRRDWLERQRIDHLTDDFKPQPFEQLAKVLREMGHAEDAKRIAMLKQRKQRYAELLQSRRAFAEAHERRRVTIDPDEIKRLDHELLLRDWNWLRRHARWLLHRLFGLIVGYGYRPRYALGWLAFFVVVGTGVFSSAYRADAVIPNDPFSLRSAEWTSCSKDSPDSRVNCFLEKHRVIERGGSTEESGPIYYPPFSAFWYALDTFVPFVNLHQEPRWIPDPKQNAIGWWARVYLYIHIIVGWAVTALFAASFTTLVKKDV